MQAGDKYELNSLLPIFYSPLLTGGMIFTVLLVPFILVFDGGPTAAGMMATEEPCVCWLCLLLPFLLLQRWKLQSCRSAGARTEASGQPHLAFSLEFAQVHSQVQRPLKLTLCFSLFLLYLAYSLSWSRLCMDHGQANLHDQKFMTQKPGTKISLYDAKDDSCSLCSALPSSKYVHLSRFIGSLLVFISTEQPFILLLISGAFTWHSTLEDCWEGGGGRELIQISYVSFAKFQWKLANLISFNNFSKVASVPVLVQMLMGV